MVVKYDQIVSDLQSNSATQRQHGRQALRDYFSRKDILELHTRSNNAWSGTYGSLFVCINAEREGWQKKSSSSLWRNRLSDAISTLRWLIEKSVEHLNTAAVKAIYPQLYGLLTASDDLAFIISLDCVKALRSLLSYEPHLEHMKSHTWLLFVQLSFNVVLGEPRKMRLSKYGEHMLREDDEEDIASAEDGHTAAGSKRHQRQGSRALSKAPSRRAHQGSSHAPSPEQVEFMSLLAVLFRSSVAPFVPPPFEEHSKYFPNAIFIGLQRFTQLYAGDSLLYDYLSAVYSAVSDIALNAKARSIEFSTAIWDWLLDHWGTKIRPVKESLLRVLMLLFPFIAADENRSNSAEGVARLWQLLDGEAESRWGTDGLSLESLRLQVPSFEEDVEVRRPSVFVASTFRYGRQFEASEAFAWAILDLQSICFKKLFILSESAYGGSYQSSFKSDSKRARLENPVSSLLDSIRNELTPKVRAYRLQVLLFIIDQHWGALHDTLRQQILDILLQFIAVEGHVTQSWVFICLAAIAHTEVPSTDHSGGGESTAICGHTWDPIFVHAMRRVQNPSVCRAACHLAGIILRSSQQLVSSRCVASELENLGKDLDVQGPSHPFDSVCAFLVTCLKMARQDMTLYRLRLEDKILGWLSNVWKSDVKQHGSAMPAYLTADLTELLEMVVGSLKYTQLVCRIGLPDSPIVDTATELRRVAVIRDFLLDATLPPWRQPQTKLSTTSSPLDSDPTLAASAVNSMNVDEPTTNRVLSAPDGRERRASALLLKILDEFTVVWEAASADFNSNSECARHTVDIVVIAVTFEASRVRNGVQSNCAVLRAASKLLTSVRPLLTDSRVTMSERALILMGLEPLVLDGSEGEEEGGFETLLPPEESTGIRRRTLKALTVNLGSFSHKIRASRRELQRIIWQLPDVQDALNDVASAMKRLYELIFDHEPIQSQSHFGSPSRTVTVRPAAANSGLQTEDRTITRHIVGLIVTFMALGPILRSNSGEPTRDREVYQLLLEGDETPLLVAGDAIFSNIRRRTLGLSNAVLSTLFDRFIGLIRVYQHSRSTSFYLLLIQFLESTMHLWLQISPSTSAGSSVTSLCTHLSKNIARANYRSWNIRDRLSQFLYKYLNHDPRERVWSFGTLPLDETQETAVAQTDNNLPSSLLPKLGADEDIRVRFRVASLNAHLFSLIRHLPGWDPGELYNFVRRWLTQNLDDYEHMVTRMLCLGNIIIVSSSVRPGPYWHLLEIGMYAPKYNRHLQNILEGVCQRMGLSTLSHLFQAYASQISYSLLKSKNDFLRFPPQPLGFQGRKDCAEAGFRAVSSCNLLGETEGNLGQLRFERHCDAIGKTPAQGILECFPDIVGHQILFWIDESGDNVDMDTDRLLCRLWSKTKDLGNESVFNKYLESTMDRIILVVLTTLKDQDFTSEGPICQALANLGTHHNVQAYRSMFRHRKVVDYWALHPTRPTYAANAIVLAIRWLTSRVPEAHLDALSYHVLHQLFADIQASPFINEQLRLLNSLCLWAATQSQRFCALPLLRTFVNGVIALLCQPDLAYAAQSLLEWSFEVYCEVAQREPRLSEFLTQIARISNDYSLDMQDPYCQQMGTDISSWIDLQVVKLSEHECVRSEVIRAGLTWPREPCQQLGNVFGDAALEIIAETLGHYRMVPSRFRLVRQLCRLAGNEEYSSPRFAEHDFWRLKECIPPEGQTSEDDVDAFTSLLLAEQGRISNFVDEQHDSHSVRTLHKRHVRKKEANRTSGAAALAHRPIVLSILTMLDGFTASGVHTAYLVLRSLMTVPTVDPPDSSLWPADYRAELGYLHRFPIIPRAACPAAAVQSSIESCVRLSSPFSVWIQELCAFLSNLLSVQDPFYAQLAPILQSDHDFSEQVLPVLVHTLLESERRQGESSSRTLSSSLSRYFDLCLSSNHIDVQCLRSIVDVVLHLRNFHPSGTKDITAYDKWLELDFVALSRSSVKYGAYTTALLFLELAEEYGRSTPDTNGSKEKILFDIYSHIDEPDGFYGIQTEDLASFLIKRFHHEKQWDKAFRFHGASFEALPHESEETHGIIESLHSFGFDHLSVLALQSSFNQQTDSHVTMHSTTYQLGWRTGMWDLPDQAGSQQPTASIYRALKAIDRERDPGILDTVARRGLLDELQNLRGLANENLVEIRQVTQNLMCLYQIVQWKGDVQRGLQCRTIGDSQWKALSSIHSGFEFSDLEAIMAVRMSLLRSVRLRAQGEEIGNLTSRYTQDLIDIERKCLVRVSEAARQSHRLQIALNSVVRAQKIDPQFDFATSEEFASVLWCQQEYKHAVHILKGLLESRSPDMSHPEPREKKALLLAQLGTWISEACLEKPTDIWTNYFNPATELLEDPALSETTSGGHAHGTVYHSCAVFAASQYHAVMNSPDGMRWKMYVDRKKIEIHQRQLLANNATDPGTRDYLITAKGKAEKLLTQDQERWTRHSKDRDAFLEQALIMYSRCLEYSDEFDDDGAIRFSSLWFSNFDTESLEEKIAPILQRFPSRKFVFLSHQLSSRISKPQAKPMPKSQENLQALIVRMCSEHPFHSLYQVYCLRLPSPSPAGKQPTRDDRSSNERRAAATDIFTRLKDNAAVSDRIRDMELLCDLSLEWAQYSVKSMVEKKKGSHPVPNGLKIRIVKDLRVPVMTAFTPLDPTLKYSDIVWISRYDATFETAGGVNLPKITNCQGSDGQRYKQLFKGGGDDLRQDAVMEQVFDLVNIVLRRDPETRKRNLSIRGYKVIPLSSQAGVIEFVSNTTPLQTWLTKAHQKYRPGDITHHEGAQILVKAHALHRKTKDINTLLDAFNEAKEKLKPVMRHFFTEKHKTPMSWFTMRLNYIRSVATTSIVGHILGLGDRHPSNILMDDTTGAVVHIDLGIAFDQGTLLPVPERVPFRMTRDMIDGMGMAKTQGVFRRCAEETLRVLREGSGVITTVLEVFKHDPLHNWTASDMKFLKAQGIGGTDLAQVKKNAGGFGFGIGIDMSSGTADEAADRAVSSVVRKLDKALSVEYTVNDLIAQATDDRNLAAMFAGWSPHL